jgi:hypothetical protein
MTLAEPSLLSPAFDRARSLSRLLSTLFAIGFGLTLFYLVVVAVLMVVPLAKNIGWEDSAMVPLAGHSLGARIVGAFFLMVGVLPGLFLLVHARRLFSGFAHGDVFTAGAIAHVRALGLWLVISAFATLVAKLGLAAASGQHLDAGLKIDTLVFGIATFVAAHVMAEARRIADENASIL